MEICLVRVWGTVCDDGWFTSDAVVACRQLGYLGGNAGNSVIITIPWASMRVYTLLFQFVDLIMEVSLVKEVGSSS